MKRLSILYIELRQRSICDSMINQGSTIETVLECLKKSPKILASV